MATDGGTSLSLRCLKCYHTYNIPRSLPCTHTFCEDCLLSHINSDGFTGTDQLTRFECPLCRFSIQAPRPCLSPCELAKSFPLSTLFESLVEAKDSDLQLCAVCRSDNNKQNSYVWCDDCNETLCTQCYDAHKRTRVTRHHKVVILSDADKRKLAYSFPPAECSHHPGKHIDSFCKDHRELCCYICGPTRHNACTPLMSLDDVATGIGHNDRATYQPMFESMASEIQNISQHEEENIDKVSDDFNEMVNSMDSLIIKAKERLDDLHGKFQRNVKIQREKRMEKMNNAMDQTRKLQILIENCVSVLSAVTNRASPRHVFVIQEQMKAQLTSHIHEVKDSIKDHKELQLKLETEDAVSKIVNSNISVGHVIETESPSIDIQNALARIEENIEILREKPDLSLFEDSTSSPSPVTASLTEDKDRLTYTTRKLKSVHLEGKRWLTGVTYLPDGRVLISDSNSCTISVCDDKYNVVSEARLDTKPSDIVYSEKHQVALVRTISAVGKYSVHSNTLVKTGEIQLDASEYMCGIGVYEDTVLAGKDGSVQLLEMDGTLQKNIPGNGKCTYVAVSVDLERFCYPDGKNIVCCSMDGTTLFRYHGGNLGDIKGLSFDRTGHIYVCCLINNLGSVYQISPDGKRGCDLELDKSSIKHPYSIACHPKEDVFVVTSKEESVAFEVFILK